MSNFQRLSVREGKSPVPTLVEGVPIQLKTPLRSWLEVRFGFSAFYASIDETALLHEVAVASGLTVLGKGSHLLTSFFAACESDDDAYLDALDALLAFSKNNGANQLERLLALGNSAWRVRADARGLERRVDHTATAEFLAAAAPADSASEELKAAWNAIYGTSPDPSDGWDHAIKAVEDALIPLVVPNKAKATLADVAGQLKASPSKWHLDLNPGADPDHAVATLEGMLRLMWPNPDRHGGAERQAPELAQSAAVLHLAVALVQWARDSRLGPR